MKKIFLGVLLLVLFSCSSDNNSYQNANIINPSFDINKMIGAWVYESMIINGQEFIYQHNPDCNKDIFAFFMSETQPFYYTEIIFRYEYCSTYQTNLEWKVRGNKLSLYFGEQLVITYDVIYLSETYFTVRTYVDYDNNGSLDNLEITAKREDPYGWFESD